MNPNSCENEQLILKLLRNEQEIEKNDHMPSFVQSILGNVASEFFQIFDNDPDEIDELSPEHQQIYNKYQLGPIDEHNMLISDAGDYTLFKAIGYDSHWSGGPPFRYKTTPELDERIKQIQEEIRKEHPNYRVGPTGRISASNKITNWYVGPAIKDIDTLRFFIDNLSVEPPSLEQKENWKRSRSQCMEKNWCQFISTNMVMEGGLGVSMALISKLMRKKPELLHEWYNLLMEGPVYTFKAGAEAGFKLFCTADDMAYKNGPMMSPKQYKKFVTPQAKKLCDIVRDADGVIFMHTDGNIYSVIDLFIEAGYHAIQPLEPTSGMTIKKVKERWGDRIACIGNVDTTKTLPFGSEEEVREETRAVLKAGGRKGYMFAASGSIHNRVPLNNLLAMLDEWKKYNEANKAL